MALRGYGHTAESGINSGEILRFRPIVTHQPAGSAECRCPVCVHRGLPVRATRAAGSLDVPDLSKNRVVSSQSRPAARLSPGSASDDLSAAFGRRSASRTRHPWIVWLVASLLAGSVFAWFVVPEPGADEQPRNRWSGVIRIEPRAQDAVSGGAGVVLSDSVVSAPSTAVSGASTPDTGSPGTPPATTRVEPVVKAAAPTLDQAAVNTASTEPVNEPDAVAESVPPDAASSRPVARDLEPANRRAQSDSPDRQRIAAAQRALTAQGFDAGEPDGVVGPRTRAAIRAWQGAAGILPDGIASAALLNRIAASTAPPISEPAAGAPPDVGPPGSGTPVDRSESRPVRYALDPALERFRPYERPVFERWCARGRLAMDRLGYLRCVVEQTAQFPNGTGIADLTVRPAAERERLLVIAAMACDRTGQPVEPQRYFKCVADTIQAADLASGRPSGRDPD